MTALASLAVSLTIMSNTQPHLLSRGLLRNTLANSRSLAKYTVPGYTHPPLQSCVWVHHQRVLYLHSSKCTHDVTDFSTIHSFSMSVQRPLKNLEYGPNLGGSHLVTSPMTGLHNLLQWPSINAQTFIKPKHLASVPISNTQSTSYHTKQCRSTNNILATLPRARGT